MNLYKIYAFSLLTLLAITSPGTAQPGQSLASEQQTITRGLEDLQSSNVELRAGAVMLLGKYDVPAARNAVIMALKDTNERVRRAALVSVSEWSINAPITIVEPVLNLLGDRDVEIRRMASSLLGNLSQILQRQMMFGRGRFNDNSSVRLELETQKLVTAAFKDEDVIVRRNMIAQYAPALFTVPAAIFMDLLSDPDRQVRLSALPLVEQSTSLETFLEAAGPLIHDEDRAVRLLLIRLVANYNQPASRQILENLLDDATVEVAAEAEIQLFQFRPETQLFDRIFRRYQLNQLTREQSKQMIQLAERLGDDLENYIYALIDTDNSPIRNEAISLLLQLPWDAQKVDYYIQLSQDRSSGIRQKVMSYLNRNRQNLNQPMLEALMANPHPDVRLQLLRMSSGLNRDLQQLIADELILDEDGQVRVQTLQFIVAHETDGWQQILQLSLNDSNTEIQKIAVKLLLDHPGAEAESLLQEYVSKHPQAPISAYIESMLKRKLLPRSSRRTGDTETR